MPRLDLYPIVVLPLLVLATMQNIALRSVNAFRYSATRRSRFANHVQYNKVKPKIYPGARFMSDQQVGEKTEEEKARLKAEREARK